MKTRQKLPLAAALAAAALLTGPGAPARADETVSIGIVGAVSDITLFLAEKKGFMHEQGLATNLLSFDSGAKMVAPLGAGQLDVGAGAWSAGLFNAVQRGINIKLVADKATSASPYDYKAILVRKPLIDEGKFKSFADLKGRSVGVVANGAADNSTVNEAVKAGGLTIADVNRVYLGFSAQIVALSNGGIDVAFSAEPDVTLAVRNGIAVRFAPNSAVYPVQDTGLLLFGSSFLDKHRDTAQKFMIAYLRAVRFYDDSLKNGKIAGPGADYILSALGELTKTTDLSVFRDMVASRCNPDGKIDEASLRKDLAFFKEQGDVKGDITAEQVLDGSFVTAALKQLGPYKPKSN